MDTPLPPPPPPPVDPAAPEEPVRPAETAAVTPPEAPAEVPAEVPPGAPTAGAPTAGAPTAGAPTAVTGRRLPWEWIGAVVVFLAVAIAVRGTRRGGPGGPMGGPMGGPGHGGTFSGHRFTPPPGHNVLSPGERALFEPLTVGSPLGPATVTGIDGQPAGTLSVHVQFGSTPQTFRVTRAGSMTRSMHLRATGPYTVYLVEPGTGTPRGTIEQAWRALEAVLSHHTSLPVPPGLSECCPFNGTEP